MRIHTPGPWSKEWCFGALRHISKNVDADAFLSEDDPEFKQIKNRELNYPDPRNSMCDADLVAAAPDLLEALKLVLHEWGEMAKDLGTGIPIKHLPATVKAIEAITKAEPTWPRLDHQTTLDKLNQLSQIRNLETQTDETAVNN